ncbi:uncharacterized protein [Triticum aestivum]|nr:uncharacterized protein LOC123152592 isoform X2 [Triticum aestivum]
MEVLEDDNLNISNYIRHAVFHILSTYKGPSSDCLAAFMLGMQKEANILRELLNGNHWDCFSRLHVCDDIRPRLWKRLSLIAAKIYPIDHPYTPVTKMLPNLMPYEQGKESGNADEMGFHIHMTDDGAAVLNTPTITTTAAPAAPISWVVNIDEHDQENKDNSNTKSIGDTQGSEVPISQTSDPIIVSGYAANKGDGCRVWKQDEGYVEYELLQGVSPPYEEAEATRPDGPNAGGEEKHMLEKTTVIEEGSMKALVQSGKEIVALLKALLVVLVTVLCALCVVVYLLNLSRRENDL